MKRISILLLSLILALQASIRSVDAQERGKRVTVMDGDTMTVVDIPAIPVFSEPFDTRKYARLIYNVKVVYPIAQEARRTLEEMEEHLQTLKTQREQVEYIKSMENVLKRKYTPVLRDMTYSQGKILIKLIDRETSHTSYELVKQLRGGFRAFFWQGIARLFGANLKDRYDKEGEDKIIERIIILYELGLL